MQVTDLVCGSDLVSEPKGRELEEHVGNCARWKTLQ